MKTAKEFLERIANDEAFAKAVSDGIQAKKDAGAKDYTEALLPVAAELGYEISEEQVESMLGQQSELISEEELGRTAGGTSCVAWMVGAVTVTVGVGVGGCVATYVNDSSSC